MDLMEIYCTIRWVSEISWRRHKLFIPRVSQRTWLRHGLYPTGISFVVDEPDGDTGSIQRGSAIWLMDRVDAGAVSQGGLLYGSMDRTEAGTVPQGGLLYGRWTGLRKPTDICYMNMVIGPDEHTKEWGIIPLGVWTMFDGTTGCLTGSIELWNAKLTETQIYRELSIEIESSLFN